MYKFNRALVMLSVTAAAMGSFSFVGAATLTTFTITESFGVSHPDQIIDFDYAGASALPAASTCMVGPSGTQVPFQILSGDKIAVRTNLPANTSKSWQLMSNCAPTAAPYSDQVVVNTSNPDYIQLTNGLAGVRVFNYHGQTRTIPIASATMNNGLAIVTTSVPSHLDTLVTDNAAAENWGLGEADRTVTISGLTGACSYLNGSWHINVSDYWGAKSLITQHVLKGASGANCTNTSGGTVTVGETEYAPIQGIQTKDGAWSTGNPKLMQTGYFATFAPRWLYASNVTTTFVERGPLETVIKVSYTYKPFQYQLQDSSSCGLYNLPAPCMQPIQNGYYTSTIRLEAGQPSINIEEDTNKEFTYMLPSVYNQTQVNQGRYRGHYATEYQYGHYPDGTVCSWGSVPGKDCFRDFDYTNQIVTQFGTSANSIQFSPGWAPWMYNTGWYWMLYNSADGAGGNVVGAYVTGASRLIGANYTGFSPYILPDDGTGHRAAGFEFVTNRTDASATFYPSSRYDWGIFIGTKGNDLGAYNSPQNVMKQANLHGGFYLNKIYRWILTFADPAGGYGGTWNDPSVVQTLIQKLRGPNRAAYYNYLYNIATGQRGLIDIWGDARGAQAHKAVARAADVLKNFLNEMVNGEGVYHFPNQYWQGGVTIAASLSTLEAALADPTLTAADKATAKAVASANAYILNDNDHTPLDGFGYDLQGSGMGAGTANMPVQMQSYRSKYVLWIPQHPLLAPKFSTTVQQVGDRYRSAVNEFGSSAASPHYSGVDVMGTVYSMLQAKQHGTDYFAIDNPRAMRNAEWMMQLLTPPEVRYLIRANYYARGYPAANFIPRKNIAEGDGSTEGSAFTGEMAQGFRDTNPTLAARLMGAWVSAGSPQDDWLGSLPVINQFAPTSDPKLGNDNFLGYFSVLRNGWNTDKETALWLFNGDWLVNTGHRGDDRGAIVLYALKAPLAIQWGSMYYPGTSTYADTKSGMIVPDTSYGKFGGWTADNIFGAYSEFGPSDKNTVYESFGNSGMADAVVTNSNGLVWQRKAYSITPDQNLPIIILKDGFSGTNPSQGKVLNLWMMASGAVSTPIGPITPPTRLETSGSGTPNALPSTSQVINLPVGVNKFTFTGQSWVQHPTGGIDWDVYTIGNESQQAVIGNWGHSWNPIGEQVQFVAANGGRTYSERQHVLRVHGSNSFWTIILPYNKAQRPANLSVTQDPTTKDAVITRASQTIRANEHYYTYTDGTKKILTSFDNASVSGNGMTISGGAMEIVVSGTTATLTFSGAAGTRSFTVPGTGWIAANGVQGSGSSFTYNYAGQNQFKNDSYTITLSRKALADDRG